MRFAEARSVAFLCSLGALASLAFSACTTASGLYTPPGGQRSAAAGSTASANSVDSAPVAAEPVDAEGAVGASDQSPQQSPQGEGTPADAPARPPAVLASLGGDSAPGSSTTPLATGSAPRAVTEIAPTLDLVAVERPADPNPAAAPAAPAAPAAAAKPPVRLESVPRTSVENRPTNQIMMVRTTAYSHLEADSLPYGNKSAAGTPLRYGKIRSAAADWSKYPLGTRFMIEGLPHIYEVDDYGSALAGTETLDIYKPNLAGIRQWGARNVPIRVIEWGSFEESRRILDSRKHVRHAHHVRQMLSEIERKAREGKLDERPAGLSPAPGSGGGGA